MLFEIIQTPAELMDTRYKQKTSPEGYKTEIKVLANPEFNLATELYHDDIEAILAFKTMKFIPFGKYISLTQKFTIV